jgi:hypothetical protein
MQNDDRPESGTKPTEVWADAELALLARVLIRRLPGGGLLLDLDAALRRLREMRERDE